MAYKCYFNIFSIIHVSTVYRTAAEASPIAISAPQKRPSGEKRQKSTQSFCDEKFATKDLDREFLSIRFFRQEFLVKFSVPAFSDFIDWFLAAGFLSSDPHTTKISSPVDGNLPERGNNGTLILGSRGIFRVQTPCDLKGSFVVAGRKEK